MATPLPEPASVASDTATILAAVRQVEPRLGESVIRMAVANTCVARTKRRRVARALEADPCLLTSGRADGPVAVDQLIHALIAIGARRLVAPRCPKCGTQDALLSEKLDGRRICQPCKTDFRANTRPCSDCGSTLNVNCRDRRGRPVCRGCRPGDGEDPVARLVDQITPLAPGLEPEQLQAAIQASNKQPYALLKVSWEIEDRPGLLTGEGAHGSPHLMRLLIEVHKIGASGIVLPACPQCSADRLLLFKGQNGLRICRGCYGAERSQPCTGCGNDRPVVTRSDSGGALCGTCSAHDPEKFEHCIQCRRHRQVGQRTPAGPLCRSCYRLPVDRCCLCGRRRPCIGASTSTPRCETCYQVKHPCYQCGRTFYPRARTPDGYLCHTCFSKDPVAYRTCIGCGESAVLWHHGLCPRCACIRRLNELLTAADGIIRPGMEAAFEALSTAEDPRSVLSWIAPRTRAASVLSQLGTDGFPVEHSTLDQYPRSKAVDYLRGVLITAGALPHRDEQMVALQQSLAEIFDDVPEADDRKLLQAFAQWDQIGRLRRRLAGRPATYNQINTIRVSVRQGARLAKWLRDHGTNLGKCSQREIDQWLSEGNSMHLHARPFVKWAVARGHAAGLVVPSPTRTNPTPPVDTEKRIELSQKLLTDATIPLDLRVAGLMVVLFAQSSTTIAKIRVNQVLQTTAGVHLAIGREPLHLPGAFGELVTQLAAERRAYSAIGRGSTSPWLFPGRHPERHLSPATLLQRLKAIGITARASQHAALRDLSAAMPESVINRLLGISISSVDRWKAGGQWAAYAAELARRNAPLRN
ncbi:hypothetical protein ACWEJZ_03315 [Streptomyces bacillaris]